MSKKIKKPKIGSLVKVLQYNNEYIELFPDCDNDECVNYDCISPYKTDKIVPNNGILAMYMGTCQCGSVHKILYKDTIYFTEHVGIIKLEKIVDAKS